MYKQHEIQNTGEVYKLKSDELLAGATWHVLLLKLINKVFNSIAMVVYY